MPNRLAIDSTVAPSFELVIAVLNETSWFQG